jgi:hypothetical protein
MALYFLSVLHVMLEFPLNHHIFAGIGRELYAISHQRLGGGRMRALINPSR